MPKVGAKKFPYTSAGMQQAQKHARATGQKMIQLDIRRVELKNHIKNLIKRAEPLKRKKVE